MEEIVDITVQIKEAIEMVEERVPGGKWMVRVAIALAFLVGVIAAVSYIVEKALLPMSRAVTSLVTGSALSFRVSIGDVIAIGLTIAAFWFALNLISKNLHNTRQLLSAVERRQDIEGDIITQLKGLSERMALVERIVIIDAAIKPKLP